jgi:division protein CdvB (Snf7/Vps24/ESCRT-III family)
MSSSVLRFQRILGSLEKWFEETRSLFEREFFAEGLASQSRCQEAIDELAVLLQQPEVRASIDAPMQRRLAQLMENYRREVTRISAQKQRIHSRLTSTQATRTRATSFRQTYGSPRDLNLPNAFANQA